MIYLDSAATTFQKPPAVGRAMTEALASMSSPGRGGHPLAMRAADTAFRCRKELAELFGLDGPEGVAFTLNATHALNIAIKSLVPPGRRVVISGYEHNAVTRPLTALKAKVSVAGGPLFDQEAAIRAFDELIAPGVDVVICNHVSNVFGFILPVREIAALCRAHGIPIIVDAAAELPPKANIRKYLDDGASLVVFSGGKEIRGPQASGMILGSRELIAACELNCCPNYGIGRPMKVDKENICGLVKAVELFVQRDYDQIMAQWDSYVDTIRAGLSDCPGLEMTIGVPTEPGVQPACIRRLFLRPLTMPAAALRQALIDGEPSIYTFLYQDQIVINPQCLQAHELSPIVQAIRGILMQHR